MPERPALPCAESRHDVWPHQSCFECRLRMPSDAHADGHYAMTGHAMGWSLDDDASSWPVATDDQVFGGLYGEFDS